MADSDQDIQQGVEEGAGADALLIVEASRGSLQGQGDLDAPRSVWRGAVLASLGLSVLAILALPHAHAFASALVKRGSPRQIGAGALDGVVSLNGATDVTSTSEFNEMLDAVNHQRQMAGVSDLCYNAKLNEAAKRHSETILPWPGHHLPKGGDWEISERVSGYNWRRIAANVAIGQYSVSDVMDLWMKSGEHKAKIIQCSISHFGMARKGDKWTQIFASPSGSESCDLSGGGEDGQGGRCRDLVPKGQKLWHDSDGQQYHCDWYAKDNNCATHGNDYPNFGSTANQACCACGKGGNSGCLDKQLDGMEWYDSDGEKYHCDWYGAEPNRCTKHGDLFPNKGLTANNACCACGGGTGVAPAPTPTPTRAPHASETTPAPASVFTGHCCGASCNLHLPCNSNLKCQNHLCMSKITHTTAGTDCDSCSR